MPKIGIEEEVFITEPERPTVRSLYYLAKLLARNPVFYYTHSAHNFTRGKDVKQGLMSGVEISTAIHDTPDAAVDDLARRRQDLAAVCSGLIAPVGHLLDMSTPTNTCAIHVHISDAGDPRRVYGNLIHFLPILPLFTINSPVVAGERFGQSYRMHKSFAIGAIQDDWTVRFQDVILSKRLGTVELRACDPCWDLNRVRCLVRAVAAIASIEEKLDPRIEFYNSHRDEICRRGLIDEALPLVDELASIMELPRELFEKTASDELWDVYDNGGLVAAYSALDSGYRRGVFESREVHQRQRPHIAAGVLGFAGYFIPRLPYYAFKGLKEM